MRIFKLVNVLLVKSTHYIVIYTHKILIIKQKGGKMMLAKKNNSKKRIQVNIDKDLVDNAEEILDKLGLNTTTALTMFYKKIVATDGIPFDLQLTKEQKANANLEDALKAVPQQNIKNNKEAEKVLFDDEN